MKETDPALEHERRFLVGDPSIIRGHEGINIIQAYIGDSEGWAYRLRWTQIRDEDGTVHDGPFVDTWKGPKSADGARLEYEREFPADTARKIISAFPHIVSKQRYLIVSEGYTWEVDQFAGKNEGLIIAEFEGSQREVAFVKRPQWCSEEVTNDHRYNNENLAKNPWQTWPENQPNQD